MKSPIAATEAQISSLTVGKFPAGAQNILVIQKFLPDIRNCENTATRKKWCVSSVVEYLKGSGYSTRPCRIANPLWVGYSTGP